MYYLLLFSVLPPLLILIVLFIYFKKVDRIIRAVLIATFIHEVFLVTYPVIYSLIYELEHESFLNINVTYNDLLKVMVGESLYVFSFSFTFILFLRIKPFWIYKKDNKINFILFDTISEKFLFYFLISIGSVTFFLQLVTMGLSISNSILAQLDAWSSGIFFSFTPIVASAIAITKQNFKKQYPKLFYLSVLCLSSVVVIGILTAARGRIMWVASLIIILAYVSKQKKMIFLSLISLIIFLPFFSFLGSYKSIAATSLISGGKTSDLIKIIFEEKSAILELSGDNKSFFYSFAERAQGPRNSVVLYNSYENGESASFDIYLGSLFFPVPRFFWPTKPIPGSIDDNENNSAVFKVMDIGHDLPYMGPVLASAHAYWEGGYFSVILYGFFTAILWCIVFLLCSNLPYNLTLLTILSFSAALLIDGFLTIFSPLYAFILISWKWILPTLFLYIFFKIFSVISDRGVPESNSSFNEY